jgi:hypothetical protein
MEIMGAIITLIAVVIGFGLASTIYMDGDSLFTIETAKIVGHKVLDAMMELNQ